MFLLLEMDIGALVNSIMHWILIGTIILGSIFALIGLIMIIKRTRYGVQMRHNKTEVTEYKKRLIQAQEEQSIYQKMDK